MKGNIFNIQRFSTNDGPGIRTVVFLKGCPLSCIWCHNPESKSVHSEVFYYPDKCIGCRKCENICDLNQHIFDADKHIFLHSNCEGCMKCIDECSVNALEICGKEVTVEDVMNEILRDKEFYDQSCGGVTLSGGEPLMQYDFSFEILKKSKEAGIHTAVETSGYCHKDLSEISQYVDLWLYDIKFFSESDHIKYTGVSNKKILENIFYLDSIGATIILRCPIIPDINFKGKHFNEITNLANELKNVESIHLEPYHPLGIDKSTKLGKKQEYQNREFLSADNLATFVEFMRNKTNKSIEIL
ncbi:MAG: glycyl-radical enzyme activating protein [Clostridia bacterium]|nr:glycyl-radical enzyme activating protein [Clostridia bacterium]